eukprot:UN4103
MPHASHRHQVLAPATIKRPHCTVPPQPVFLRLRLELAYLLTRRLPACRSACPTQTNQLRSRPALPGTPEHPARSPAAVVSTNTAAEPAARPLWCPALWPSRCHPRARWCISM